MYKGIILKIIINTSIIIRFRFIWFKSGMKISDISVDISSIYPILVMFDTLSAMTDISPIYRFWTDLSWKYQVCGTHAR